MTQRNTSFFAIFLYGSATIFWWIKKLTTIKETRVERSKWKWLEKVWDIKGDTIAAIIGWIYSLIAPSNYTPAIIGTVLVASIIFSTLSTFSLFRNS